MNNRSRATLFLMEQLIVILIFSVCAAACLRVFIDSYTMARDSRDTRNSLFIAQSAAESFKASGGDLEETANYLDASAEISADTLNIYYDKASDACSSDLAYYKLQITRKEKEHLVEGDITISKPDGALLVALTVASRR